ncbi:MAG: tetratricopeptide repeat protein [Cyanobacteria bacterium HKST-UBA01]|nr:tetratricopeptide repeat protein [Cyanobacteria bacterium HKST-UBA01]
MQFALGTIPGAWVEASASPSDCSAVIKEATSLFARGKVIDASRLLEENEKRCSNSAEYQLLLSTIMLRRHGKSFIPRARQAAKRATELDPESKAAWLQLGICCQALEDNEGAAYAFEGLLKTDPTSYEAWSSLGQLYLALGKNKEAQICARKAACLEPESREARLKTIGSLARMGKLEEARGAVRSIIEDDSLEPEFFILVAEEAVNAGAFEEAIKAADRALATYPDDARSLKCRAISQLSLRRYKACLETTAKLRTSGKNLDEAFALEAMANLKQGNAKGAALALAGGRKLNPANPRLLVVSGIINYRQGKVKEALADLKEALAENQLFPAAHLELARIYINLGDSKEALEEAMEIARNPEYKSTALAMEGKALMSRGSATEDLKSARKKLESALNKDEKNPEALLGLGELALKSSKVEDARKNAELCLKIEPGNTEAMVLLSRVKAASGDKKGAEKLMKSARAAAPGDGSVIIAQAEQLIDEGDTHKAVKLLQGSLDAFSAQFPPLEYTLAKILNENGDKDSALKHFKNSLNKGLAGKNAKEARKAVETLK